MRAWKPTCCFVGFEELRIKQFKYWSWVLNPDQDPFIGRSIVYINRHAEKLLDTKAGERDEFFKIIKKIESILDGLFKVDKYNYAQLGNNIEHLHFHVVPRYKKPVKFANRTFVDKYWGDSYDLNDSSKHTEKELNSKIAKLIRSV